MKQLLISLVFICFPLQHHAGNTLPPEAITPQLFCENATVANLVASGEDLKWYQNESDTTPLTADTSVFIGTYFVSQTIDGIESERFAVEVIIETPLNIPSMGNIEACDSYFLPDFWEGGYYTQPGGNGAAYSGGEEITMSQVLYRFASSSCGNFEEMISITINASAYVDFLDNVYACDYYELQPISSGNYYTAPNTGGALLLPGYIITTSQTVYLYAGNGCGSAQSSFYIEIADIDTTVNQWYFCGESQEPIEGATSQSHVPTEIGAYAVNVSIGECSEMSECFKILALGTETFSSPTVTIFPNPASSSIQIGQSNLTDINEIIITDMTGKTVFQQNGGVSTVNIEYLTPGIYLIRLLSGEKVYSEKLIKQ